MDRILQSPATAAAPTVQRADASLIARCVEACAGEERGVIVCGPAPLHHAGLRDVVHALAEHLGYPLLAEATSQLRLAAPRSETASVDRFELLFRSRRFMGCTPRLTIELGTTPTSAGWERFLAAIDLERIVVSATRTDAHEAPPPC